MSATSAINTGPILNQLKVGVTGGRGPAVSGRFPVAGLAGYGRQSSR